MELMKNPMPRYAVYKNNMLQGYVSAVSYRQAVKRAKAIYRGPLDVIGTIANAERVIPLSA